MLSAPRRRRLGLFSFPTAYGGADRIADSIAAFETLAFHDLSLLVKFGVQFGLFGGSVYQLGTEPHHRAYINAIGTMQLSGCFAMTETDHGSNVRDIETTATFDVATDSFVIHTPTPGARKDYIGNAALHGRMATVFAQLQVGTEQHGVHAFLVPIREQTLRPMPGVTIEDCGLKAGLNGVDNGRIYFDRVRIPRGNLLNRFADVSTDGKYTSPIESPSRRFFTMLGTLVAGRISIAGSCSVAKLSLTIATKYAVQRRQFGPEDQPEVPIMVYQSVQRELLPRIAATFRWMPHCMYWSNATPRCSPMKKARMSSGDRSTGRLTKSVRVAARTPDYAGMPRGVRWHRLPVRESLRNTS